MFMEVPAIQFLVHTGPVSRQRDTEKSIIYSHIAKRGHQKRRQKVAQESQAIILRDQEYLQDFKADRLTNVGVKSEADVHEVSHLSPTIPLPPLLLTGNCDPFDSHAVRLDAKANEYIYFSLTVCDSVSFDWGFRAWRAPRGYCTPTTTEVALNKGFDLNGLRLLPKGLPTRLITNWSAAFAYSLLANSAGLLGVLTGSREHHNDAIIYSQRCAAGLDACIRSDFVRSVPLELLLFRMFKSEIAAERYSTAIAWGKYLRDVMYIRSADQCLNFGFLSMAQHHDNILALGLWEEPIFDLEWLEERCKSLWTSMNMYPLPRSFATLYTGDRTLQRLLEAARELLIKLTANETSGTLPTIDNWYWYISYGSWLEMKLFIHYKKRQRLVPLSHTMSTGQLCDCLALATMYAIRQDSELIVRKAYLSATTAKILDKMGASYGQLEACMTVQEAKQHKDALLWVVYMASMAESRQRTVVKRFGTTQTWKQQLVQMIVQRGLYKLIDLQRILEKFPYTTHQNPLPTPGWLDNAFEVATSVANL